MQVKQILLCLCIFGRRSNSSENSEGHVILSYHLGHFSKFNLHVQELFWNRLVELVYKFLKGANVGNGNIGRKKNIYRYQDCSHVGKTAYRTLTQTHFKLLCSLKVQGSSTRLWPVVYQTFWWSLRDKSWTSAVWSERTKSTVPSTKPCSAAANVSGRSQSFLSRFSLMPIELSLALQSNQNRSKISGVCGSMVWGTVR